MNCSKFFLKSYEDILFQSQKKLVLFYVQKCYNSIGNYNGLRLAKKSRKNYGLTTSLFNCFGLVLVQKFVSTLVWLGVSGCSLLFLYLFLVLFFNGLDQLTLSTNDVASTLFMRWQSHKLVLSARQMIDEIIFIVQSCQK